MDAEQMQSVTAGVLTFLSFWLGYWWRGKRLYSYTDTCGIGACTFKASSSNAYALTQVMEHHRGAHPRPGLDEDGR